MIGRTALFVFAFLSYAVAQAPPGVVIDHSPQTSGQYIGSPSIASLPDGTYVATHDLFGPNSGSTERATTRVFESKDRGRTWTHLTDIAGAFWSTVFYHRGALYLIGTTRENGDAVIRRSVDGGRNWTEPDTSQTGLLLAGHYHCAPQPVVAHRGRIWRAMEDTEGGGGWGKHFRAFMMSVPEAADLLNAANWTFSNRLGRDASWLDGQFGGWLEGNAVVTPAGGIVDILRVDHPAGGKAAMIVISPDGRNAEFNPATDFIDLPGGAKKFTIRWDRGSKHYWALTNYVPPKHSGSKAASTRNTLALASSSDLRKWDVRTILLHHPDRETHGFQYVDWLFEDNDIIAVCRTAFDDSTGGAHNAHDANYLTFHRIANFRKLTMKDSIETPESLGIK